MLLHYLEPVPFTIDNDSHLGLSETRGLLSCDGDNLVIEFQIADTIIGAWKGEMEQIEIPIGDLIRIEFRSRFFGFHNRLTLHSRRQDLLNDVPEAKQGRIVAAVRRGDREAAGDFCIAMSTAIQQLRGERLDIDLGRMELE